MVWLCSQRHAAGQGLTAVTPEIGNGNGLVQDPRQGRRTTPTCQNNTKGTRSTSPAGALKLHQLSLDSTTRTGNSSASTAVITNLGKRPLSAGSNDGMRDYPGPNRSRASVSAKRVCTICAARGRHQAKLTHLTEEHQERQKQWGYGWW